jgi:hypothetical protein|tara:strand:+ start:90 stop:635 length:546 start_codon:yes stop_codon:yes gene_type:complete
MVDEPVYPSTLSFRRDDLRETGMFPSTAILAELEKSDRKITFGELQTVRPCQHDLTEEQIHKHAKRKVQESWKGKNPIDERIRCKRVANLLEEIQKWQMHGDVGFYGKPDANMRILCDLPRCIQRNQSIDQATNDARPGQENQKYPNFLVHSTYRHAGAMKGGAGPILPSPRIAAPKILFD